MRSSAGLGAFFRSVQNVRFQDGDVAARDWLATRSYG